VSRANHREPKDRNTLPRTVMCVAI
jgi:hypothetical protein